MTLLEKCVLFLTEARQVRQITNQTESIEELFNNIERNSVAYTIAKYCFRTVSLERQTYQTDDVFFNNCVRQYLVHKNFLRFKGKLSKMISGLDSLEFYISSIIDPELVCAELLKDRLKIEKQKSDLCMLHCQYNFNLEEVSDEDYESFFAWDEVGMHALGAAIDALQFLLITQDLEERGGDVNAYRQDDKTTKREFKEYTGQDIYSEDNFRNDQTDTEDDNVGGNL
jgi:hypothetical protein